MSKHEPIRALEFNQLFDEKTRYIVPIYQRNYEWGEPEITQLVRDIADACLKPGEHHYYLGSLVVYRRPKGHFEVIDGQQRLTTLNILKSCLAGKDRQYQAQTRTVNLAYEHRDAAQQALANPQTTQEADAAILQGFRLMQEALNHTLAGEGKPTAAEFIQFLEQKVLIVRTEVPEHTDLNHYFEIMNTRGEQLEKHEILKAHFMQELKEDEQALFALVWDACSDMSRFAVSGFPSSALREKLFGKELDQIPVDFSEMLTKYQQQKAEGQATNTQLNLPGEIKSIHDLINSSNEVIARQPSEKSSQEGKLASIIDFPNFLMHILLASGLNKAARLDEKFLLEDFGYQKSKLNHLDTVVIDAKELAVALLKCRMLFDRYILKADSRKEEEGRWAILKPAADSKNSIYPKDTFGLEIGEHRYRHLEMVQSMFHVSFNARNYKTWLQESLVYLYQGNDVSSEQYLAFFEKMAAGYYQERAALSSYPQIPYFTLNYVDYLLWKAAQQKQLSHWLPSPEERSDRAPILEAGFANFAFFHRSSIEHFYPQNPEDESKKLPESATVALNSIGNLCLIGHSSNSKLSNHLPIAKQEKVLARLGSGKTAESLNQLIMMMYREWNVAQIQTHTERLKSLLAESLSTTPQP